MAAILASARLVALDIKIAHSVFALPFAVLAAVLARPQGGSLGHFAAQLAMVVGCMVAARTWAMLFNRIADAEIDARNPRTARRAVASGALSKSQAWTFACGAAALFVAFAAGFGALDGNWWPAALSVPVLAWIAFYSLTKRFTWLCHVFLGGALAASPVAAAIAVNPSAAGLSPGLPLGIAAVSVPAVWALAGMVVCWVAGFDVIYALQDTQFDRGAGLHSVPSRLGVPAAIWIARLLHVGAVLMLILAWRLEPRLAWGFLGGIILATGLIVTEHVVVSKRGERGIELAFFTLNGVVSVVLGFAGVLDAAIGS